MVLLLYRSEWYVRAQLYFLHLSIHRINLVHALAKFIIRTHALRLSGCREF
jgi:hypothetical protein